jgi:two-component system nitrogen regulation sensor histidine kinase GlnL
MTTRSPRNRGLEESILENLNTAVLLFDPNLSLCYVNPAGEMLFALSARYMLGLSAGDLITCPGDLIGRRFRDAVETRHPFTEREVNIALADGRTITVNCTVLPLHHFGANVELLVELHQVDRQLRISREEHLISQHQATQALIRGLAHEIKNPLGGLRGAAQLLEQELPDRSLREYTRIIIDEADRLQKLMDQMLGPNRMPERRLVNIHHVLERVRSLILAEYPSGPRIRTDYDPSIPDLMADSDRLIQALLNISRNAANATGRSGRIILRTRVLRQFTIGSKRHRLVLRVEVEDDGPGIPEELQERIFFPMVTGTTGGTGLGLPIAQELVNQHAGLIECASRPGKTQFFVNLPLETNHDATA